MFDLDTLNPAQQEAVFYTEGPLLILAGAGSGKTRVLTHRIAYLIGEKNIKPWNILAITFTNKAAGEMRERVDRLVPTDSDMIWVSTFHSLCVRILRRYIDRLGTGYRRDFTIYDASDQKETIKKVCRTLDIDTKVYKEKTFMTAISSAKDELVNVNQFYLKARSKGNYGEERTAAVYEEYQQELKRNNALDFDDLIMKTVELLSQDEEVLEYYQDRFRYIMVDEYQDTNTAQFRLIDLIARKYRNLCVVGDDDQSIYRFRGANIRNILDFEKNYTDAKVIKLEQNYRSTANILNGANEVILHNNGRKQKTLWTRKNDGEKIRFELFPTERDEAEFVCRDIERNVDNGGRSWSDHAVLYRTNAQSRVLEERMVLKGIPYKIIGGQNFYGRKEIKDVLSYLRTINNGNDDLSLKRVINEPKRGIGKASVDRLERFAYNNGISMLEAAGRTDEIDGLGASGARIAKFGEMIRDFREMSEGMTVEELLNRVLERTGYIEELQQDGSPEAMARIENIDELITKAVSYDNDADEPTLQGFLEDVALVADIDDLGKDDECVVLMTLHSAKGLEFPCVYMTGMEENLFPGYMTINGNDPMELEEERRLCYVGMTRAEETLTMTSAKTRMTRGTPQFNEVSRFIREIPGELIAARSTIENRGTMGSRRENRLMRSNDLFRKSADTGADYYKEYDEMERRAAPGKVSGKKGLDSIPGLFKGRDLFGKQNGDISTESSDELEAGSKVQHRKYGVGRVLELNGDDVKVEFEEFGIRNMKKAFAGLKKIK